MSKTLADQLEQSGYFKGLSSAKAQDLKNDFVEQGWFAIFSESHRCFSTDAEDLAEGGIGQFISETAPFLESQGVELPQMEDDFQGVEYVVRIGNVAHRIYDKAELERSLAGKPYGLIWGLSMIRGFRIVDQLLTAAGSEERLYAINGGNDLLALFLTPAMHQLIASQPGYVPKDGPYVPVEECTWYGQPH